jgi:hypothetical protein
MNNYEENNEIQGKPERGLTDEEYFILVDTFQPVFFEQESASRVLGSEHPTVRLMEDAQESLDEEKLKEAQAAFDALPEEVLDRIYHPWMGCPPPPGTAQKLTENLTEERIGDLYGLEMVEGYLQIDAREVGENAPWPADEDGHTVDPALVYDLRENGGWPVRVQIAEGSNPKVVKELLQKILANLERWDELTDPNLHLRLPKTPSAY